MTAISNFYGIYSLAIGNGLIFGLAALGLYVSLKAGLFNLSEAGFFSLGAYSTASLLVHEKLSFPLALTCSCIGSLVLALALSVPLVRLRGHFLGIATLGFGGLIEGLAIYFQSVTGGEQGFNGIPADTRNIQVLVIVLVCVFIVYRLESCRTGRIWRADSEDSVAAGALGAFLPRYRVQAFCLTALLSALAGGLYAANNTSIVPEAFGFNLLTALVTYASVGGLGGPVGGIIAALFLSTLPDWASSLQLYATYLNGALLIAVVLFVPQGAGGLLASGVRALWRRMRTVSGPEKVAVPAMPTQAMPAVPASGAGMPLASDVAVRPADGSDHADGIAVHVESIIDGPVRSSQVAKTHTASVVLQAAGVTKSFGGVRALRGVDLVARTGEILGVIGPNGSGKTTMINCLSGAVRADEGSISVEGREISGWSADRIARYARVRRTFQNVRLISSLSVIENVILGMDDVWPYFGIEAVIWSSRFRREERRRAQVAGDFLASLGLAAVASRRPGELAYGLQRRVELARACVANPRLLLIDEPTAGMNEEETMRFAIDLRKIVAALGSAVVVIEHKMNFIRSICDNVVVLNFGEQISSGPPEVVLSDATVADVYLGANATEIRQSDQRSIRGD